MISNLILLAALAPIGYAGFSCGPPRSQICSFPGLGYGFCAKWSECSSAQEDFYVRKVPPLYCSYDWQDPVVCCYRTVPVPVFAPRPPMHERPVLAPASPVPRPEPEPEPVQLTPDLAAVPAPVSAAPAPVEFKTSPLAAVSTAPAALSPAPAAVSAVPAAVSTAPAPVDSNKERISLQKCNVWYPAKSEDTIVFGIAAVNGDPTVPGEFKHMAAIGWKNGAGELEFFCGGTLISENFVLTAAHCASLGGVQPDSVHIGGSNLNETFNERIPIEQIYVHERYKRRQVYHDLALLKLTQNSDSKPACLWQKDDIEYTETVAIGYGHTTFGGKGSNALLKVFLSIYTPEECVKTYQPGFKLENGIIDAQICAADRRNIQDTCQGDSGGPLMVKVNETYQTVPYILGITSFGQGCASGEPSVYTRVSSYLDWIEMIVWPA